ncbi:MAG: hypothetical protein DCC50_07640 [Acidobacteria bacterium]|nr:MAG: hypothetical protein DCC50_07640 [Acidobacteriota bacterium]
MTPTEGQRPHRGQATDEDDPTGIRDLLRTLPDPGPMPVDLVERISARLSEEQEHRAERGAGAGGSAPVVDLSEQRSRRRPGRTLAYLGVAAAGLLVATVAVGELAGDGLLGGTAGMDSAAQVSTHSRGAADGGSQDDVMAADGGGGQDTAAQEQAETAADAGADVGDAAAGADAPEDADAADEDTAAGAGTAVELLPPLGEISAGAVREDVLAALERDLGASSDRSTLTPAGAERCWQAGGVERAWPVRQAAEAVYAGDPVVVLVGRDGDAGAAVLVPAACTGGADVEPLDQLIWGR